jgi:hypothetical protein
VARRPGRIAEGMDKEGAMYFRKKKTLMGMSRTCG